MSTDVMNQFFVRCGLALVSVLALVVVSACGRTETTPYRTFATPEEAVDALAAATKAGDLDALIAIFGPDGRELAASSDPATARMNRQVFLVASRERKQLIEDSPTQRTLVIGNEEWPFPVPIVKEGDRWRFDTEAGYEEVIARRIGRNEMSAIDTSRAYVAAQRRYAAQDHDGKPAGLYAMALNSDPGKENGLYWPAKRRQKMSPLGDLVAQAALDGTTLPGPTSPTPFRGYYFKILKAQGPAAPGGAKDYVVKDVMSGGFALIAWPAEYDVTGVMTFIVGPDGVVRQQDLGPKTDAVAPAITAFNPEESWAPVE